MEATVSKHQSRAFGDTLRAYLSITKPRIGFMVVITCLLGYYLGSRAQLEFSVLLCTLLGTFLSSSGAAALNNMLERDVDRKMERTRNRPVATGDISPAAALSFGTILVLGGVLLLVSQVNLLTGFLALLTAFLYVLVYTPLKRITWLNTAVGAIPGALPPMGGWAAATGELELGAWALFLIMFIWQHPHFFAIAWMYKEDYRRGGFQMLPVIDETGERTFRQVRAFLLLLVPVSLLPFFLGFSGPIYALGAILTGFYFFRAGELFAQSGTHKSARLLLHRSLLYLPLLFLLIVIDSGPNLLIL